MNDSIARRRGRQDKEKYAVEWVPISDITPSPENDQIYGEILHDEAMENLIDSIRRKGLDLRSSHLGGAGAESAIAREEFSRDADVRDVGHM